MFIIYALAIGCHLIIFSGAPLLWQAVAVLLLAGLLPGILFVEWLIGGCEAPPTAAERILYSIGASYLSMVFVMMLVSYLPGPVARWQTFAAFDFLLLLMGILVFQKARMQKYNRQSPTTEQEGKTLEVAKSEAIENQKSKIKNQKWLLVGLLSLLLVGGALRLVNLDYAEFQGDEARAAQRAAGVIQGYEDVLLIHKKGPTEILLPTVLFSMTGHLNEQMARLPFALANLAGLFALFLLGWRLFGPIAGWTAAMFLAVDGYFIGFSHIVQYQSIVFLTSVLVVLLLHRLASPPPPLSPPQSMSRGTRDWGELGGGGGGEEPPPQGWGGLRGEAASRYLTLAALFLAIGLLSHYEAVFAVIPATFLLLLYAWRHCTLLQLIRSLMVPLITGGAVLASFYVPFLLHPNFSATYTYLADRRIGGNFPYNNLKDFFVRTTLYSTTYYVALIIILLMAALMMAYVRGLRRQLGGLLGLLAFGALGLTFFEIEWLEFGDLDLIVVPFALTLVPLWLLPRLSSQERMLWLWFGIPLIIAFFFTQKPRTHVYVFFMPWLLLAGMVVQSLAFWLQKRVGTPIAATVGIVAATGLFSIFGLYAYWYFVYNQVEILRTWDENRPAGFWTIYDEPDNKAIFGFPLANGWKVVGSFYQQGIISGNYGTNEKEAWVPDWYARGEYQCARDADWYFQIENLEPFGEADRIQMVKYLEDFQPWGYVEINGTPRMIIHRRSSEAIEPQRIQLEEWEPIFDQSTSPYFPLTYPAVTPKEIANRLDINFGNQISLEGYEIKYETPLNPGDSFQLKLYWRAQQPITESYKIFNHVYFGDSGMQAQLDGYPLCDSRPTWRWDPGTLITDNYYIPVEADATAGLYPLYTGLYLPETGARLPVLDETGAKFGSQIHVTDIRIGEEP